MAKRRTRRKRTALLVETTQPWVANDDVCITAQGSDCQFWVKPLDAILGLKRGDMLVLDPITERVPSLLHGNVQYYWRVVKE